MYSHALLKRTTRSVFLGLTALSPASVAGQDSWSFGAIADVGSYIALRNIGKSAGEVGSFQAIQAQGDMMPSLVWGGGVEAVRPDGSTWFRLLARTTSGARAEAYIGLCTVLPGDICERLEVEAAATSLHGQVGFTQGSAGDRARGAFFAGLGVRRYRFGEGDCSPFLSDPDMYVACGFMADIFEAPSSFTPFVEIGFEVKVSAGPVEFSVRGSDLAGPYSGGGQGTESTMQNDIFLTVGVGVPSR